MRRLMAFFAPALLAVLVPVHSASAAPRVGPPLQLQLYLDINETNDPPIRTASLDVSGTQCLPQDAPASVIVTLDRAPGQVFTATPNANGRWLVSIPVDVPLDGVFVVNAECDNYFGSTVYPTAQTNADDVIIREEVAGSAGGGSRPPTPMTSPVVITDSGCAFTNNCVANTGNQTGSELGVGLAAIVVGSLFVFVARPRRSRVPARHANDHRPNS